MKTATTIQASILFTLALMLTASAQGPQGRGGGGQRGGQQGGPEGMGPPATAEEMVVDLLDEFDLDEDLALSEAELEEAIAALPQAPTPLSEAADWIAAYDTDESGTLSATELAVGLEANKPQRGRGGPPRENQ